MRDRSVPYFVEEKSPMRNYSLTAYALTTSVALIMLAGCSGGNPPMASTTVGQNTAVANQSAYQPVLQNDRLGAVLALRRSSATRQRVSSASFFSSDAKGKPLLFVSDYSTNNAVDIYLQAGKSKMVGQITGLNSPANLATDKAGNLYVANFYASTVLVYAPFYTKAPKLVLDDTGNFPVGVAASPRGVVAVMNQCTSPSCALYSPSVTFYSKDSTKPCATFSDLPTFQFIASNGAFDDRENLYFDGFDYNSNTWSIGEITGACKAKNIRVLTTDSSIAQPFNIQIDRADRIAVFEGSAGQQTQAIDTYNPPKMGSLGSPVSVTSLTDYPPSTGSSFVFAFSASGHAVYTATFNSSQPNFVLAYGYPAGGTPEKVVALPASASPGGLAVTPPLLP
jgi:hypothetical protein